jgi:hypothetical protein
LVCKDVDKPAKIWHITVALLIVVHLQLNKNNYFNFAKARREKRSRGEREGGEERGVERRGAGAEVREEGRKEARTQKRCEDTHRQESTSEREYEVDA